MDHQPSTSGSRENANYFKYMMKHLYSGASVCPFPQEIESIEKKETRGRKRNGMPCLLAIAPSLPSIEGKAATYIYTYFLKSHSTFILTDKNKI